MTSLSQKDLWLVMFFSLICLALIWLSPLQIYPIILIPYILLLILPGYALMTVIKPHYGLVGRLVIGFLLGLLFLFIFVIYAYINLSSLIGLLITILFLLAILFSVFAIIRRHRTLKDLEGQPTRNESIRQIKELIRKAKEEPPREKVNKAESGRKDKDPFQSIRIRAEPVKESKVPKPTDFREYLKKTIRNPIYTDLILIVIFTLVTAVFVLFLPVTYIRTILGVLLVLFIPGYSLISALYPRKDDLDGIERVALSFGLSIVVTPLFGYAFNYTPLGVRLDPILIGITGFTLIMVLIAYLRRRSLPVEEKFMVPFTKLFRPLKAPFQGESKTGIKLSVILIIVILLAVSTTAYVIAKPKQQENFTEFYLLGQDGKASNYPTNLTTGQQGKLIIGVINHEFSTMNYQLVVSVNNVIITNETISVQNNAKKEIPFTFTANPPGQDKMEFLLYKLPDNQNVYRSLHLTLNVR